MKPSPANTTGSFRVIASTRDGKSDNRIVQAGSVIQAIDRACAERGGWGADELQVELIRWHHPNPVKGELR